MINYLKIAIRIFLLVIFPSLISFFSLFPIFEKIDLERIEVDENKTIVIIPKDISTQISSSLLGELKKPNLRQVIANIFQVPFDLGLYEICFVDKGSRVVYGNHEDYAVNATLNFNNKLNLTIPNKGKRCVLQDINEDFTYDWQFNAEVKSDLIFKFVPEKKVYVNKTHYYKTRDFVLSPRANSYAKIELRSAIISSVIFVISWIGLLWLINRCLYMIRNGIFKQ